MSSKSWDCGDSSVAGSIASVGEGWEVGQGRGSVGNGSLGSQVLGPGSLHGRLVHWDHGSVGVTHQLGVQVQRTSVPCSYKTFQTREKLFSLSIHHTDCFMSDLLDHLIKN